MSTKWTEQDVMNHAKALKSPFEKEQNGDGRIQMIARKLQEIARRQGGITEGGVNA